MLDIDILSDTTYRNKAVEIVTALIDRCGRCPLKRSQIHGLHQIANQQPLAVTKFADHQRERADRRHKNASESGKTYLQHEIDFWHLVVNLCDGHGENWSLMAEAENAIPDNLAEGSIPTKQELKTPEDRSRRKELLKQRREWQGKWKSDHIPAFFQRFFAHYLYLLGQEEG